MEEAKDVKRRGNNNNNTHSRNNSNTKCSAMQERTNGSNKVVDFNSSYNAQHSLHNLYYQRSGGYGGYHHHHHHHNGYYYPALLPLPPPLLLQLPPNAFVPENMIRPRTTAKSYHNHQQFHKASVKEKAVCAATVETQLAVLPTASHDIAMIQQKNNLLPSSIFDEKHEECFRKPLPSAQEIYAISRPDLGGIEGPLIPLLANHFLVQFDPTQKIFHYDVSISPCPSKEIARMIKNKLVEDHSDVLSGALPVFDGRKNLYSPIQFQDDKLEFFIHLPVPMNKGSPNEEGIHVLERTKLKLFKVNMRLCSKLSGQDLEKFLKDENDCIPLPQNYLHALDVVLRESTTENCIQIDRSSYSSSIGVKDIGGGVVGLRGFFQGLRPTKQGLALNVDFCVTAFHESIGIIPYLQKHCSFLQDLSHRKTRGLIDEEKKEVEKALKNVRVFVCHRESHQKYRVFSLTDETTEKLKFKGRDGQEQMLIDYFKDQYNHDIQFRKLPCLQISRSKPCYLPMELCVVCEGQKFLGKLSDEQTSKILKMGCQRPKERKDIINGVMTGDMSPASGRYAAQFQLNVSKDMTQLSGRILQPPKLKLGDGGQVREITPNRYDRQWNLLGSHVPEGCQIRRWALISFGGNSEQRSCIPKFVSQLSYRCEQLGISLNRKTVLSPLFEQIQVLNNVSALENKLRKIHEAASGNLQLLICIMEKKHKGYADLKRISETRIGVVSQCCLYSNVTKLNSQFLANLALKINAKLGGSNVTLYNTLPCQLPRVFSDDEPAIFMGADVTHPHPLDDYSPSVAAVVGSMNWPAANKYISRMRSQTHRQEIIADLAGMVRELLEEFFLAVHKLPSRIIFFRDGVSETMFYKVLKEELHAIRIACQKFLNYEPAITFIVVQKRHHTRLFLDGKRSLSGHSIDENIPPGTVVDTVITHPREFDFYLCSHWGMKGTSRPTHYHILWDENHFKSDEVQKLIHDLCYTFVRCTKPVSLVPPAYYAHLAAYRGRLYLDRSDSMAPCTRTTSRPAPLPTMPLPKLKESVKKLMFYC